MARWVRSWLAAYLCFSGVPAAPANSVACDLPTECVQTCLPALRAAHFSINHVTARKVPLKEKLAAIQEVDAGVKKTEVALTKDKLQNNVSRFAPDRKRLREAAYLDLENGVLLWLKCARSSNLPINGPILREKATREELSLHYGIEGFKCSDGWISRFKERHGLSFKT
ncbi:hypothetical protein HPB50_012475 [Hyalomma asiaticum]|uniref:Uncharacterized protein n=1 Tax=Hyalomma asiaticum TaxID=266040 RepID=A0ACB7THH3_HYAAI|nr:hypothetical protein HPB50_012475 [Hyalomma asiaticum]